MDNADVERNPIINEPVADTEKENVPVSGEKRKMRPSLCLQMSVIVLACVSGFGLNFCMDSPYSMQAEIMSIININTVKYDLLLSFTAIPNVFMAVASGLIVDYFIGLGLSLTLFTFGVCIGQGVFMAGCYVKRFWLMILGRVIFGLSSESVQVCINKYGGTYLRGKSMVMFFSCLQLFCKFAEFINMFYMHDLYNYISVVFPNLSNSEVLGVTFGFGLFLCILSTICAIILGIIDHFCSPTKNSSIFFSHNEDEEFRWKHIAAMPARLWLICVICALSYSATTNYNSLSLTLYIEKYLFSPTYASKIQGYYIIVAIVVSPLLGATSSYIGFDGAILYGVFFMAAMCYTILVFAFPPIFSIIIPYGLTSSIRNVLMWPMVSYIVPKSRLGTAYVQAMQNIFLIFVPIFSGLIAEKFGMVSFVTFLISILSVAAILLSVLCFIDSTSDQGSVLLVSYKKRRQSAVGDLLDEQRED